MKLQRDKWYVCIKNWSDDGWTKFFNGMLVQCYNDDFIIDVYGIGHFFAEDDMPEMIFREATELERNIASVTEVNMEEFMKDVSHFENTCTLEDIYRQGAEEMLFHIRTQMSIKGKEEE